MLTGPRDAIGCRTWHPGSWRDFPARQQPDWDDPATAAAVLDELSALPGLVRPDEVDELRGALASVSRGQAIMLQAGDCAERFTDRPETAVRGTLQVIAQMSVLLGHGAGLPVVKVGRIAGQFGKPRSLPVETVDGVALPVYRGDIVNGPEPTAAARRADPRRMRRGYDHASGTLDLMRRLPDSGFCLPERVHARNREFVRDHRAGPRFRGTADEISHALRIGPAGAGSTDGTPGTGRETVFTSHEALLLPFEQALTRRDPVSGRWYALSAHQPWLGDRTRGPDGAHVEFLSGVANPIGIKVGPTADPEGVLDLCERLDPHREPGRLTLIVRLGAGQVVERLVPLVETVVAAGRTPVWLCDPMHGNTRRSASGHKTRRMTDVLAEIEGFFSVHRLFGTHPGGLHLELTGTDVTECVGGEVLESDLATRYETACDPRLNAAQSVELAFRVAELFGARSTPPAGG